MEGQRIRPLNTDPLLGHPKYMKVADLNRGAFGFVQLAKDVTTGEQVAIKFIERGDKISKYVEREIINHKQLRHPHIVELKEVFLTPEYLAIAMEYATDGDMFQLVVRQRGLLEKDARWYFQQLIVAVDYCHRMGVANRDIKLENVLIDSSPRPLIKICDFGYSKHEKYNSAPGSRVGTPAYLAPEVVLTTRGKTYNAKIADVWSCGVMLYVMLAASYPFGRPEDERMAPSARMHAMLQRILKVEYALPSHAVVTPECQDLLSKILAADPAQRITLSEVQKHPWYTKELPPGVAEMNDRLLSDPTYYHSAPTQSLEETLHIVREAMTRPQAAVQLNLDNDDSLDSFIEVQGNFDEDLPYLSEGNLLPFLSSLELQQHDF
ncbi:g3820 [Coccomyxa viridis]|uniref:G3820 protein n=1 Tax=Coccomyxa viridis TaxID=1274662 RepID=A0ABP1FNQ5_9CHLO